LDDGLRVRAKNAGIVTLAAVCISGDIGCRPAAFQRQLPRHRIARDYGYRWFRQFQPTEEIPMMLAWKICSFDAKPASQRSLREPAIGSHLTTSRRGYSHHGIYVGGRRVVHYSGLSGRWQWGPVEEVSLSQFARGHEVRTVEHPHSIFSPEEVVRRARSRLGENDYRLLTNNCEHFCNWCICGVSRSVQLERPLVLSIRILAAMFHEPST